MRRQYDEDIFKDTTMTFGEHLEELRMRLFKAILGLVVGFLLGLAVGGHVVNFIQLPLERALKKYYQKQSVEKIEADLQQLRQAGYDLPGDPEELKKFVARENLMPQEVYINPKELAWQLKKTEPGQSKTLPPPPGFASEQAAEEDLVPVYIWRRIEEGARATSLSPHEPFMIYVKASLVVGILIASPWVFYQIWSFVAAGLYPHEKRYVHVYLPFSVGLFLAGAATAFFLVFEPVLRFLFSFNAWLGIAPDMRIQEWLEFVLLLPLGFGIAFQLPLVMLFLERIGIFTVQDYLGKWRIAVLAISIISMFLTPPDPYSMILMGVPLTAIYFGGILLCKYMPRRRSAYDDELDEG
jgi:sec-independent protein translocase protein TatC